MPMISDEVYQSVKGDTYETISIFAYANSSYADVLRTANPGIFDPGVGPLFIKIPLLPLAAPDEGEIFGPPLRGPGRLSGVTFDNEDEVSLVIDGVVFKHWDTVNLTQTIDSFTTVTFTAPFESDDANFRNFFQPLSFKLIQLFIGGRPFFFGRMVNVQPQTTADKRQVSVGCYSYSAVVNDITKALATKADFTSSNLLDITNILLQPHAIIVKIPEDQEFLNVFSKVSIQPKTKLIKFLSDLAEQRKAIITDNANGDLVYQRVVVDSLPVAHLQEGLSPLVSCAIKVKTQNWFSDVTGARANKISGSSSESHTIKNPFIQQPFRPFYFTVKDEDGPVVQAVESKFARMLADVMTCECEVSSWRDNNGQLFQPNTLIDVTAPSSMIYSKYRFLISKVKLGVTAEKKSCLLSLSLPGSYTGTAPESLPWAS